MHHVHPTLANSLALPTVTPPIADQELQRLRARAWAEVAAIEAGDRNYQRSLHQQVQNRRRGTP
ncbi:hypothetical protein ASF19_19990 [Acidovorax sp. Leaf84]|uniref:hypothetical protein n=1 Tax=Acidovorax sp. Leaf84 TaxID=1736240 RepID=UPI0006FBC142|nr:hypothetical protein [Acidovorax sp. Leaf84]KQO38063.1 hypothetical protein ASF19_19990 [Acidovorax sp. Leaf84]RYF51363.1 MAG: hypothetical protein EOO27_30105 [Comamonadaceae bacterium]